MGRRDHGNRLLGDIDPELQAAGTDGREVLDDEIGRTIGDIEVDALGAQALHLVVNGAGHDVARRELGAGIEAWHEALAVRKE
jgi:hypothetical protein